MEPASESANILSGLNIYVETRTEMEDISRPIAQELKDLGANIFPTLKNGVTHVVYRYGTKKTRDWAEKKGVHMVTVGWVKACKDYKTRMPEGYYRVKFDSPPPINPLEPWKKKRHRIRFMQPLTPEEEERLSAQKRKRKQRDAKRNALKQKVLEAENQIQRRKELDEYLESGGAVHGDKLVDFYHLYYAKAKIYVPPTPAAMVAFRERQARHARGEITDSSLSSDESQENRLTKSTTDQSRCTLPPSTPRTNISPSNLLSSVSMPPVFTTPNQPTTSAVVANRVDHSTPPGSNENRTSSADEIHSCWQNVLSPTPNQSPGKQSTKVIPNHEENSPILPSSPIFNFESEATNSRNVTARKKRINPNYLSPGSGVNSPVTYVLDSGDEDTELNNLLPDEEADRKIVSASDDNEDSMDMFFHPSPVYHLSQADDHLNVHRESEEVNFPPLRHSSDIVRKDSVIPQNATQSSNCSPIIPRTESLASPQNNVRNKREHPQPQPFDINNNHSSGVAPCLNQEKHQSHAENSTRTKKYAKPKPARRMSDFRPCKQLSGEDEDEEDNSNPAEIEVYALPRSLIKKRKVVSSVDKISAVVKSPRIVKKNTRKTKVPNDITTVDKSTSTELEPPPNPAKAPRDSLDDFCLEKTFTMERLKRLKARKVKNNHCKGSNSSSNVTSTSSSGVNSPAQTSARPVAVNIQSEKEFVIAITSLHTNERNEICATIGALSGARLVDNVTPNVTHLIGNEGPVRRTLNLLMALVITEPPCHIVTRNWVTDSLKQKRWIDEAAYKVADCLSLEEIQQSRRLFLDYDSFYVANLVNPPRTELVKIIEGCGGKVIKSFRQAGILIGAKRPNAITVEPKWIFDSIMATEVLPIENYLTQ